MFVFTNEFNGDRNEASNRRTRCNLERSLSRSLSCFLFISFVVCLLLKLDIIKIVDPNDHHTKYYYIEKPVNNILIFEYIYKLVIFDHFIEIPTNISGTIAPRGIRTLIFYLMFLYLKKTRFICFPDYELFFFLHLKLITCNWFFFSQNF